MLFPELEERVIYDKNPLIEVICQFRYPTILRIDAQEPIDFQENVRKVFPGFREKAGTNVQIPQEMLQLMPREMANSLSGSMRAFEFSTLDNAWVISLTREFISLTNTKYTKWEDFSSKLKIPIDALNAVYEPSAITRVGLRYQNVIRRSELGLKNTPWSELINPALTGFFASSDQHLKGAVEEFSSTTLLNLDDNLGRVRINCGLVVTEKSDEICFLIDNDFFTVKVGDIEDGLNIINKYNQTNRRLFHWAITNRLHEAMEPRAI